MAALNVTVHFLSNITVLKMTADICGPHAFTNIGLNYKGIPRLLLDD
jgi:hypothetical protein